jgi:hypothetical protein
MNADKRLYKLVDLPDYSIDVVIPLGPSEKSHIEMFPLSMFIPKALVPIGVKPMLWRILENLQDLERFVTINRVHLIVQKNEDDRGAEILEYYLKNCPNLPLFSKFHIALNSDVKLCDAISNLDLQSNHFLLHFDDIILKKGTYFYKKFAAFHFEEENSNGILGSLAYSCSYPLKVGLITRHERKGTRMSSLEEKPEKAFVHLLMKQGDIQRNVCINMAIGLFKAAFKERLKGLDNNLFINISKMEGVSFGVFEHQEDWFHVNGIGDLIDQHVRNFYSWNK